MGLNDFGAEKIAARPLEFIWIVDISGSMSGDKIQALNHAVRDSIPEMVKVAGENVNAEIYVRVLKFADTASWHVAQRTLLKDFKWTDLDTEGLTSMGEAMRLLAGALDVSKMPSRGLPPVLVLLSDGEPTDDFNGGLKQLFSQPWAKKAVKIAIAIGDDAAFDVLQKFIDNVEIKPLLAKNAAQLTAYIKWASTQVLKASSQASSTSQSRAGSGNIVVPPPPVISVDKDDDVW